MPFLGDYKIYDTAEPCNYTGQKLIDTMEKVVSDGLSADGRELNLMGCCVALIRPFEFDQIVFVILIEAEFVFLYFRVRLNHYL